MSEIGILLYGCMCTCISFFGGSERTEAIALAEARETIYILLIQTHLSLVDLKPGVRMLVVDVDHYKICFNYLIVN